MILKKQYSLGNRKELFDFAEDVMKAFAKKYKDKLDKLPVNKNGMILGKLKVTVEWSEENKLKD